MKEEEVLHVINSCQNNLRIYFLKKEVPLGGKYQRRYCSGYGRVWYPHARAEGEHHPWAYDPLDWVGWTEPSNYEDGSGAVYMSSSILPPPCHLPKGGADKTLYSPKVFGVVVWWKTDFQGSCQVDGSQSWEGHCEHESTHVKHRGPSESKRKLLVNVAISVLLYGSPIWADTINTREYWRTEIVLVQWKAALRCVSAYRTVPTEAVCVLAGIPRLR